MTAWDDIRPVVQGEPQEATRAVSAVGGAPGVSETHTDLASIRRDRMRAICAALAVVWALVVVALLALVAAS